MKRKSHSMKDDIELAQDALVNEVSEEVRVEQLEKAWNKYKYFIVGMIVLFVGGLACFEGYSSWKTKVLLSESDLYEKAAVDLAKGNVDGALEGYISLQKGKTNYRYLAQLRQAGVLLKKEDRTEGLNILNLLRGDSKAPEVIRSIAALSYVSQQIDTAPVASLQEILNPYMNVGSPWYGMATELSVLLLIREGDLEKAKRVLDETLSMSSLLPSVRERLEIIKKSFEG